MTETMKNKPTIMDVILRNTVTIQSGEANILFDNLCADLQETFGWESAMQTSQNCPHCGNIHQHKCPLVKSIEYHQDGTVKKVEFMTPVDYQHVQVPNHNIWPERPYNPPIYEGPTC